MFNPAGSAPDRPLRFSFVSSNFSWGGSEDLWSETAAALAVRGHFVDVYKNGLERGEGNVPLMVESGCRLTELGRFGPLPKKFSALLATYSYRFSIACQSMKLVACLRLRRRPDLVILSQGGNHDGWPLGSVCRWLGLPYVLVIQKASDLYWPDDRWRANVQKLYGDARHSFFVAMHNRHLTEEQIGRPVERASIVRNPFKVSFDDVPAWPASEAGFRFACVGRLYVKEKGQDVLLRVLARDKWRARNVRLTIFGTGEHEQALRGMAAHLGLDNVVFGGFANDIDRLWAEHHALLLASRAEGLPLVVVEAMLCGRVPIVTDVGGNREVVADGATGFIAAAPTEDAFDAAMERAWQARDRWPEIGARAARAIRDFVPPDPAAAFAEQVIAAASGLDPIGPAAAAPPDRRPTVSREAQLALTAEPAQDR
jgi:glycosyltransferase involved in cell wall biosynthesis